MSDLVINDASPTVELLPETVGGDLGAVSKEYGPKRVKTPNMEVEQFDPSTIQRLKERDNTELPSFGSLSFSIGTPSPCGYSNRQIRSHEQSRTNYYPRES